MSNPFKKRVFGCAVIKSINSNYNADFSHQPRMLPNGTVYATDKVLKYSVRNYWKKVMEEDVFYFKTLTDEMSPRTLDQTYENHFGTGSLNKTNKNLRFDVLSNLLSRLDVRLFGGTYAGATNISIHGTCQITHGLNRFAENVIYSEQIMSPFRNPGEKNLDSTMTTLGNQSKLQEGHYVHHFSVNPKNIEEDAARVKNSGLLSEDIEKLKEALRRGVTYYDSSAKSGTENELLLWIELKEGSKIVLPSLVELVTVNENKEIDLAQVTELLKKEHIAKEIDAVEVYYQKGITKVINAPADAKSYDI
ncbi:MAG: type I CRISPR-associated protein Cas7 [Bernardetiaceae bacterium]|nr:type I CRISPR-associated protein Cas7 [Bernardetiaceae bacterium]